MNDDVSKILDPLNDAQREAVTARLTDLYGSGCMRLA